MATDIKSGYKSFSREQELYKPPMMRSWEIGSTPTRDSLKEKAIDANKRPIKRPLFNVTKRIGNRIPEESESSDSDEEVEQDLSAAELSLMRKVLRTQLLVSSHEVEILRQNSKSPLYSVKSFEQLQLTPNLLKGVYAMGFNTPSKIQETTLPTLLADPPVNMIAQSQSGTGKTAAFVLSSLARVNADLHYPQVLILAPTYELALQIGEVARKMAAHCDRIEFRYAVRGENLPRGSSITEHIVIGTPGKVFNWTRRNNFFDLQKIKIFVLDEADVMMSTQGHHDECLRIHKLLSQDCQMMLFSATYTAEVIEFAEMIIREPIIIQLKREEETLDNVKQYYVVCHTLDGKYTAICNVYGVKSIGQAIIFCRTRRTASWLGSKLSSDGHAVGYLSGELGLEQRLLALTRFREGKEKVLITTNVCARGIDVEQVTVVVNFDLPVMVSGEPDCETYLHRIGRSGRFGKRGIAINMITDDRDMTILKQIERHFGKEIKRINTDDVDELESMG